MGSPSSTNINLKNKMSDVRRKKKKTQTGQIERRRKKSWMSEERNIRIKDLEGGVKGKEVKGKS